jgi:hypothetical protein
MHPENPPQPPVTEDEATTIIREWGRLHDLQAGLSAFLPLMAEDGFFMRFGEKTWTGYAAFEDHQITKRKFFDELHDYTEITVTVGHPTTARTVMFWTYRFRPENSPRSHLLKARLEHTWEFRRCPRIGRPFMQGHTVDRFEYLPGFRPDDQTSYDPHLDSRWGTRGS